MVRFLQKGHSTTRGHNVAVLRVIHKTLALFCSSTDVVYKCAHGCVPRMRCAGNSIAYDAFIYRMTLYRPYSAPQPHCQRQTTLMRRIQSPTESGSVRSALVGADNIGEERDAENCKFENARGLCGYRLSDSVSASRPGFWYFRAPGKQPCVWALVVCRSRSGRLPAARALN